MCKRGGEEEVGFYKKMKDYAQQEKNYLQPWKYWSNKVVYAVKKKNKVVHAFFIHQKVNHLRLNDQQPLDSSGLTGQF